MKEDLEDSKGKSGKELAELQEKLRTETQALNASAADERQGLLDKIDSLTDQVCTTVCPQLFALN
jgi:hypothetical protein